jgi:DNA-binding transcriptional regulator GbsR (MarR family)
MEEKSPDTLVEARDEFVTQWGAIGSAWGINRTMAQIHALLMTSPRALSTDEVMEELHISRGNANTNLRDLVGWGLIKSVIRKGERKEYFEAEKDTWKMVCTIARERKRREIAPALEVLRDCGERTKNLKTPEALEFNRAMSELSDFLRMFDNVLNKVGSSEQSKTIKWIAKFLS